MIGALVGDVAFRTKDVVGLATMSRSRLLVVRVTGGAGVRSDEEREVHQRV